MDRWATEVEQKPAEPIIADFENTAACLSRLFDVRHILCHEMPRRLPYSEGDIDGFLEEALRFTKALEEIITFEMFGRTPLTQTEMNVSAHETLKKKESELEGVLMDVKAEIKRSGDAISERLRERDNKSWLDCLEESQRKWLAYRDAHAEFDSYPRGWNHSSDAVGE